MALSVPRAAVVDLITKLEVLSKDHGCILDLSAILDVSVCPTIDIFLPRPHTVEPVDHDYIYVTPTAPYAARSEHYTASKWCPKKVIDFDLLALVGLGLLTEVDLELYLNLDLVDIDIDIALYKRTGDYVPPPSDYTPPTISHTAPANHYTPPAGDYTPPGGDYTPPSHNDHHKGGHKGSHNYHETPARLGIDLDVEVNVDIDLSIELDLDIEVHGRRVRKAKKHFAPHCGKKIPETAPGCKKITARDPTDCLAQCHAQAIHVSADVNVGNVAHVADCVGISFDHGLTVDNCLVATLPLLGIALIDAEVDTLIRL